MKLRKAENFLPGSSGSVTNPFGCPTSDHSAKAVASGASKPPMQQVSRSDHGLTTAAATQSMSSESSACSQVFNLAQWHNGTMIPDSTTIPQDPQGFSATSALCNKSENAANTWDTIWYNGCSWLKRIMVNYDQLCCICISQNCCIYISICRAAPHPMGCPCFFVRIPLTWAIWTNQSWPTNHRFGSKRCLSSNRWDLVE